MVYFYNNSYNYKPEDLGLVFSYLSRNVVKKCEGCVNMFHNSRQKYYFAYLFVMAYKYIFGNLRA